MVNGLLTTEVLEVIITVFVVLHVLLDSVIYLFALCLLLCRQFYDFLRLADSYIIFRERWWLRLQFIGFCCILSLHPILFNITLRSLVSYVTIFSLGIALSQVFEALLLRVLFLNMRRFIFMHVICNIRFASKHFTHDLVLNWVFVNVFDYELFLVVSSVEMMSLLVIMKVIWFGIYDVFTTCWGQFNGFFCLLNLCMLPWLGNNIFFNIFLIQFL